LLALALYASTVHAGMPAGFGGTPGVVNENTPHYDLELLYHDRNAHRPDKRSSFGSLARSDQDSLRHQAVRLLEIELRDDWDWVSRGAAPRNGHAASRLDGQ
jgi:hypothetical protein